jgi:hypothetical protein
MYSPTSASSMALQACRSTAFSRREKVGCEARSAPLSGSRPHTALSSGSTRRVVAAVLVGVAAGDLENPLADQRRQAVQHWAAAPVGECRWPTLRRGQVTDRLQLTTPGLRRWSSDLRRTPRSTTGWPATEIEAVAWQNAQWLDRPLPKRGGQPVIPATSQPMSRPVNNPG